MRQEGWCKLIELEYVETSDIAGWSLGERDQGYFATAVGAVGVPVSPSVKASMDILVASSSSVAS